MIETVVQDDLLARRDALVSEFAAISTALAIGNLDPQAITDLRAFLSDFKAARARGDQASVAYVLDAIAGLFRRTDMSAAVDNESVMSAVVATSEGAEAVKRTQERATRFAATYRRLKEGADVSTQQEVAALCGLGLATVQAMEAIGTPQVGGKGSRRPHFATLRKLAEGFNSKLPAARRIAVEELWK